MGKNTKKNPAFASSFGPRRAGIAAPTPPWITSPYLNCPCGSGNSFRKCCRELLQSLEGKTRFESAGPALRRAELARYVGWVFEHTQPLLEAGVAPNALPLANVDLHAIVNLTDRVTFDLKERPASEVLSFFSRLEQYLPSLPGLKDAILSHKAGWLWFREDDEAGCDRLLEPLHSRDLASIMYAPLLELYLDFYSNFPVVRQLRIVERILELHNADSIPSPANLLHYALLRGLLSLMLGDFDSFRKIVNESSTQHLSIVECDQGIYSQRVAAMTHEVKWRISGDPGDLGSAIEILQKLTNSKELSPSGVQDFRLSLGILLSESGAFAASVNQLSEAGTSAEALVNLSDAYIRLGRRDEAAHAIQQIDRDQLNAAMKLECIAVDALLLDVRDHEDRVRLLIDQARGLDLPDLYFQRTRDQLCIKLLELCNRAQSGRVLAEKSIRRFMGWFRFIAQFLELKPNCMGIGINFNRLIEGESQGK